MVSKIWYPELWYPNFVEFNIQYFRCYGKALYSESPFILEQLFPCQVEVSSYVALPLCRLPRDRIAMRGVRKRVKDGEWAMTFSFHAYFVRIRVWGLRGDSGIDRQFGFSDSRILYNILLWKRTKTVSISRQSQSWLSLKFFFRTHLSPLIFLKE